MQRMETSRGRTWERGSSQGVQEVSGLNFRLSAHCKCVVLEDGFYFVLMDDSQLY